MTIPIIPGPFSFLKGATDAGLDAYYRAQARKDMLEQLERQKDLQNVGLFTQMLPYMQPQAPPPLAVPSLPMPGGGVTPQVTLQGTPAFEVPSGIAESFKRVTGGVPRLGKSPQMRQQDAEAQVAERTIEPTVRTVEGRARLTETAAGESEDNLNFMRSLNPTQLLQYKKVLSPELAALADEVSLEKMKTELAAQDPTRKELEVQGMIRDALLKQLPKDKGMMKIAEYASIGGLGYLIAGLQQSGESHRMTIAANRDRINMMNQITLTARQLLTQAENDYRDAFDKATNSLDIQLAPEKKKAEMMAKAREDFIASHPKPDAGAIFAQVQQQFGMTPEEFQQTSRLLSDLVGKPPEAAKPPQPSAPAAKRKITQDQADFLKAKGRWDPSLYEIIK